LLNLTEDVGDIPLSALALLKEGLLAKNVDIKVLSVFRNEKRYLYAKAQFEDHLMSGWLGGTQAIDGLPPFNKDTVARPPSDLTSDIPFINKVKMSPSELKLNVSCWRSDKNGETFFDIDDVHKKMWDIAPDGFRARYNQLSSEFSAKFGKKSSGNPGEGIAIPGNAGNPDPLPESLAEVPLSSLQSNRTHKSAIVNLQILHTEDGIYVANDSAENIQVPSRTHLGGYSSGTYVTRTADLPNTAVPFDFPLGDATIVHQEESGNAGKITTLSLYNCLRTWSEAEGLTQLQLTFFKDPERKLSADKNKDTYALTKDSDRVYVHDDKKDDNAAFDAVPFASIEASELLTVAFRLRLVKTGLGKGVVKPRKPCVISKAGFAVKAKHAVRVMKTVLKKG
jgi:hypothetical protein